MEIKLEIESRHSDYGRDAGGYRVLRFNGIWIGRVDDYVAAEQMVKAVNDFVASHQRQERATTNELDSGM